MTNFIETRASEQSYVYVYIETCMDICMMTNSQTTTKIHTLLYTNKNHTQIVSYQSETVKKNGKTQFSC